MVAPVLHTTSRRWRLCAVMFACLLITACAGERPRSRGEIASDINARKADADALISSGRYEEAAAVLAPLASEKKVRDAQVFTMLGRCQWKLGAIDEATETFETALRLDYTSYEAHLDFAKMLLEADRVGRALTEFELAARYAGDASLPYYDYGLALYNLGRTEQALAQWEIAHNSDPHDPRYAEALGIGFAGGDDTKALGYFELAEELGADGVTFHHNYGLLLDRVGQTDRAVTHLSTAVDREPDNAAYRLDLATAYMKRDDFEQAIALLEDLHRADPEERAVRIYLARSYLETKRYEDAIRLLAGWIEKQEPKDTPKMPFQKPVPRGPSLDEGFGILAMSQRGVGDLSAATAAIEQALALAPRNVVHLINYGVILAEDGRIQEARAQWGKVLDLEPDNAVAKQNLSATER